MWCGNSSGFPHCLPSSIFQTRNQHAGNHNCELWALAGRVTRAPLPECCPPDCPLPALSRWEGWPWAGSMRKPSIPWVVMVKAIMRTHMRAQASWRETWEDTGDGDPQPFGTDSFALKGHALAFTRSFRFSKEATIPDF